MALSLVVEQCHPLSCDCWFECSNSCFKPIWVLFLLFAEGVHGAFVNGVTGEVPSFFSTVCRAGLEGVLNGVNKTLA